MGEACWLGLCFGFCGVGDWRLGVGGWAAGRLVGWAAGRLGLLPKGCTTHAHAHVRVFSPAVLFQSLAVFFSTLSIAAGVGARRYGRGNVVWVLHPEDLGAMGTANTPLSLALRDVANDW